MGIFNLRLTMGSVWNKIPDITKKLVLANKEERPDLFELEYYGFEYNDNDPVFMFYEIIVNILKSIIYKIFIIPI
ncbi:MAG: hypothetical protein CXB60_09685 [Spiroplasma poulsonii]|nr:hypothetical protein [Spiroplasma poulsonii]